MAGPQRVKSEKQPIADDYFNKSESPHIPGYSN